jgi:hypothetical protein
MQVRLLLQHTTAFNFDGINGAKGVPTKVTSSCDNFFLFVEVFQVLPVRLDTGDIILFHNTHLASQATKM